MEDTHIVSFSSLLERELIRRSEFNSFNNAALTISKFTNLYNNERLHSGVYYHTPRLDYLKWKKISMVQLFNE